MISIILHGRFAKDQSEPIRVQASSVFEAIEAVSRQLPSFKPHPVTGKARICVVGYDTVESLHQDLPDETELHVVPQLNGGKSGNALLQIVAGVALIGLSFVPGVGTMVASIAMKVGAMMLLGGISQLLAPAPETDKDEQVKNRYLGSPGNTVQIGTRIPILYGRYRTYGHFLSFDVNSQQLAGITEADAGGK